MDVYRDVLEKVARKEIAATIIWVMVTCAVIFLIWTCTYRYYKKQKKRPKSDSSEKQNKERRQSFWAAIALTVILITFVIWLCFSTADTVSDIRKDVAEDAYVTFVGSYTVRSDHFSKHMLYDRWVSVDFSNGEYAFVYINNFVEWLSLEEGTFEGKVVYGKNSLIVVGN